MLLSNSSNGQGQGDGARLVVRTFRQYVTDAEMITSANRLEAVCSHLG